jgi:hypothetical protein
MLAWNHARHRYVLLLLLPPHDIPKSSMVESGSLCVATTMMNIFWHPSKVARKDLKRGGSSWICTNQRRGKHAPVPPPIIKDKRNDLLMNNRLTALVKRVAELREDGLRACHCVEEFHLRRICPLGHREKLSFECPRLSDPSCEPAKGKSTFFLICQ